MKISLAQQIEEIDREIELRVEVYKVQVFKGKMRQSIADYHMARINAVRATLVWLQQIEPLLKQRLSY